MNTKYLFLAALLVGTVQAEVTGTLNVLDHGRVVQTFQTTGHGTLATAEPATAKVAGGKEVMPLTNTTVYTGQAAIDFLGDKLPTVAEREGFTPESFKQILLTDPTIKVDEHGKVLAIEEAAAAPANLVASASTPASIPFDGNAFKLHSKPGAKLSIYLDTDGQSISQSAWNSQPYYAQPWNVDASTVYTLWAKVAEHYVAWDVDVTTEEPSQDKLLRTSVDDTEYGLRVIVTGNQSTGLCSGCGGVAHINSYADITNYSVGNIVWVFPSYLSGVNDVSVAAAHEAGHALGLYHDGTNEPNYANNGAYYFGDGDWAPIMGAAYYARIAQWSKGEYQYANNKQDDLAVIGQYLPKAVDDITSTAMVDDKFVLDQTTIVPVYGFIGDSADKDTFTFTTRGGNATFMVNPLFYHQTDFTTCCPAYNGDLAPKVTIVDTNQQVVATGALNTTDGRNQFSNTVTTNLAAGTYQLVVESSDWQPHFTTYASIGQYMLTGTYAGQTQAQPPVATILASTTNGVGPLTVNFDASQSTPGFGIATYQWTFGDELPGDPAGPTDATTSHTYQTSGTFTVTLTMTNEAGLTSTSTTSITVTAPKTNIARVSKITVTVGLEKAYSFEKGKYKVARGHAVVTIINEKGKPVKYTEVQGFFGGGIAAGSDAPNAPAQGISNGAGAAQVMSPWVSNNLTGSLSFTVQRVSTPNNPTLFFDKAGSKVLTKVITKNK